MTIKLKLRFEGEEYPAQIETTDRGAPKSVWLTDPVHAPLALCERVEALSWMMGLDGGWACVRSLANASPRYGALIERIAEASGSSFDNADPEASAATESEETPAHAARVQPEHAPCSQDEGKLA
jgi:hypothetical protein